MASFPGITDFALIFEYDYLLIFALVYNGGLNLSAFQHRVANCDFFTIGNQENFIQLNLGTLITRKPFHIDNLAR